MSRSPLAYPLVRGVDGDTGGAADLQTDVMRFMAILALCLVAIFALVQSIPLAPEKDAPQTMAAAAPEPQPQPRVEPRPAPARVAVPPAAPAADPREPPVPAPVAPAQAPDVRPAPVAPVAPPDGMQGFTLRFESDLALARLVASGQVGFYAMSPGRVRRMSVRANRITFWDASQPDRFHEMERATVPQPVVDALRKSGAEDGTIRWGVTLPGTLSRELESIMQQHAGGALVIGADGSLTREAS